MKSLQNAIEELARADAELAALIDRVGPPRLGVRDESDIFAALVRSVVFQQLNGRAAETIFSRLLALFGDGGFPTPHALAERPFEDLRSAGLSRSKAASVQDIARRTISGELPTRAEAQQLDDESVVARLVAARGVGRWTAEMVLIFCLGRLDVMPVGDFGVRKGFGRVFGDGAPAEPEAILARAERWRPYRSVASWYLWRATELDFSNPGSP
ncbi:MAG: DNA-3-methyladenine glycosylase 2 family protein [Myxococcales bacterium]|nr:DNA-3-methyladenine glycosylase 2 family protein [Myxococcales bacterium]